MRIIEDVIVSRNSGKSFVVKRGQSIRVTARSVVDFVVFNLDNLKERFDQARTKVSQSKIYISSGDILYSKFNNVMMTIIEDTYEGKHDLQFGMCSRSVYDLVWRDANSGASGPYHKELNISKREDLPDHGCWENLTDAVKDYNIRPEDIPSPFNLFQDVEIDSSGRFLRTVDKRRPEAGKEAHVDLRAEMNCLVAVSACPELGNQGREIRVQVLSE